MSTNNATNSSFPLPLTLGGTNTALTPSDGGVIYSTATALAVLAGTAIAGQLFLSGASGPPSWSTATFPTTTTINQLLFSSASNTLTGLATANSGTLVTNGSGVPSLQTLTAGQVLIGTTASAPAAATLTAGSGISITSASGSITIASTGIGSNWVNQTTSTTMAVNTSYLSNSGSLLTFTLPTAAAQGTEFSIAGVGAGGWKIAQAAGQQINFGNVTTTSGTGGSLASTNAFDNITLLCVTANTQFVVVSSLGNVTYV